MHFYRIILAILFILNSFLIVSASSLPKQYRFSSIDVSKGLSGNQVRCFLKDSQGYLWIGTAAGLNRYDGYKLKVYSHASNDSSTLIDNNIHRLFEGPEGEIWLLTSSGVNVYEPKTQKINRKLDSYLKKYSLPNANVEYIHKDNEGSYWFICEGKGITRYNPEDKSAVNLLHSSTEGALATNYVSAVKQNSRGDIWLVHYNGMLERLNKKTLKVTERNDYIHKKNNQQPYRYDMTIDSEDDLWIYLVKVDGGVYYYRNNDKSVTHFYKDSPQLQLNNNAVRGVVEEKPGKIWIGTDHGGINIVDKKSFKIEYIRHSEEASDGLSHNSVNVLYKDNTGIIWIGTFKKGVNYYHDDIIRFPHYKHLISSSQSLPYNDVNVFEEDEKGNLWIGTNGGGLLYMDRQNGSYQRFVHDPANPNSLAGDVIVSLLIDKNKELWIGTYLGGLDRFDGKTFTHYKNDPDNQGSITDNSIWEIFEDSKGRLWVATLQGGLNRFDSEKNEFVRSTVSNGEYTVHSNYLSAIMEDKFGNLWVGGGIGIDIIDTESHKVKQLVRNQDNPESLISNNVTSIFRDSHNAIWVGTSEGLELYNEKDNSFYHYSVKDGLPSNIIVSILEDDENNLWLSTASGLSQLIIDRKVPGTGKPDIKFRNYDETDGLQGKAFNENSAFKTSKGELIFGGANGFNIFRADKIGRNTGVSKVVFTDFQLFNRSLEVGEEINGRAILTQTISADSEITLKHNENVFSIEFAALNFFHPEKNNYKYMLEGFDKKWHSADEKSRKVTYTNLDPGTYTFKVIASNNDGVWNEEATSMKITVLAPFWKTKTAYAIYVALIIVFLYLLRKIELDKAKMNFQLEQERREARQTHELGLMKVRFFTNVSHEFRTPIALILAPIEKLLKSTKDQDQLKQLQMIHRNGRRLLNLVNQLLDFRKLEVEEVKLHLSDGNVVKFIEESVYTFADLSEKKNISLSFNTTINELYVSFDLDKLEKILFNLLSNAFKFTPESGNISVTVDCHENDSSSEAIKMLVIKVKDTGIGIPQDKLEKVFERFFKNEVPGSMVSQGSGIGLAITKEFVKIHGGMISVESEPDKGSCFTITIPVKEVSVTNNLSMVEEVEMPAEMEEMEHTEGHPKIQAPASVDHKPVVLLVEDNEDFRFYLKDNLGEYFTIIDAANGKEGWQKALSNLPDLIVSDLMMPEMNGIDLCKKIKADQRTSHIPFVLLTAHKAEELQLKSLSTGANDFITKPFNFEILLSRLSNLITQRQMLQEAYKKKISVQTSEINIVSLDDKLIQNAVKLVEENLSDPDFSVELMSKELGMSRVHLYKKMVSLTGMSPVEFIRKIRLQRAAQFLEKSQLTVAEVAYKVGFNNRKYFTKYFKDEYHILPSQYAESKHKEVN